MSTWLTSNEDRMVDSHSLKLVFSTIKTHELISNYVSEALIERGYESALPSTLRFLSTLECGVNYSSEIARRLNVSRQMVAKTVKELSRVGYLDLIESSGKQKQIVFTEFGQHLMADARMILAELDKFFEDNVGERKVKVLLKDLESIQKLIEKA